MILGNNVGTTGTFNLGSGTVTLGTAYIGFNGAGYFEQDGGTVTVGKQLYIDFANSGSGSTYNLNAGSLSTASSSIYSYTAADLGTFTQTGGTHTTTTLSLQGFQAAATYNLNGGILQAGSVVGAVNDNNVFRFNGGTLQATTSNASWVSGVTAADVRNNGAFIDTNGYNVTLVSPLVHSTVIGDQATDGGLTKVGAGTLTLAGANTYTGPTNINAGTLDLTNSLSLQNSTLNLVSGGQITFDSSVSSNAFTLGGLTGNANLALVNNAGTPAAVTVTVGGNNASTAYSGALSGGTLDKVGTGTLTLTGNSTLQGIIGDGTINQTAGSITVTGIGLGASNDGAYNLSGGSLNVSGQTFVSDGINHTGVFTLNSGVHSTGNLYLTLTIGSSSNTNVGIYNLNGGVLQTPSVNGSTNSSGLAGTSQFYFNGGTLQARLSTGFFFQGVTTAAVRNGGALIDTNSYNVTAAQSFVHSALAGDAPIDGGLTKLGAGTLTLAGTNTCTGPTTVNAGMLTIDNNPGAATVTTGQLTATSGITVNNGGTLLLSGSTSVNDRLNNAATLTVNSGGKFATGGLSEGSATAGGVAGIGALTLAGGSGLDFGSGSNGSTILATSGVINGSGTVSVLDWTGTVRADAGAAGNDRLIFVSDPHFTTAQLAQVSFYNDSGALLGGGGSMEIAYNGYTELVPVPEPATWAGGGLTLAAAVMALRRRIRRM